MSDFQFNYKPEVSHRQNFVEWRTLNSEERSAYNEVQMTQEEAEATFLRIHGEGDLKTVDIHEVL
tara:strand:+ start:772 stop:966 length:195 start_codon:yes stop_codon:yes gene_type:complete